MFAIIGIIPKGMIALFRGAIADIPAGWALCNGQNGTPDLRNRFVMGAGYEYNPDDTGGSIDHFHAFTVIAHKHTIDDGDEIAEGTGFNDETENKVASGVTEQDEHYPPFYALAYIVKL